MSEIQLIAKNFVCYPEASPSAQHLSSLIRRLENVVFSIKEGINNSNQRTSDFDERLKERFLILEATVTNLYLPSGVKNEMDFCFLHIGKTVAVEIEKSNKEKILYDILKAHIYLNNRADFVLIFLPKKYFHGGSTPWQLFETGKQRFDLCLENKFGHHDFFNRILLVGYDQTELNGNVLTRRK